MSPSRAELICIISAFDQSIAELKALLNSQAERGTKIRAAKMLSVFQRDLKTAEQALKETLRPVRNSLRRQSDSGS
jgi:hypothetical protein